ncbi:MAG: D-tyrosyl-tRNA(Tyr) deacylase [Halobacteriovoraceae bacterium]|nr:D-tyrosyl-tRNA(Tyr) deacylase [Halobacteriovoraceae bacterium]MCB9094103.1 D-tyrosyl-tRNA(Tyr) deacylase [Halobacteriovoraceae bacterium]
MKIVVQRVSEAKCVVENNEVSSIKHGLVLLTCLEKGDTKETIQQAAHKILNLRIFEDQDGKMNQNIQQVEGEILNISQFTLCWDGRKGHRPSFEKSMPAREANLQFEVFNRLLEESLPVKRGVFGADMAVSIVNDGPVTFHLNF